MNKGERLVYLRERKSKSQTEAARYLGVSKQTLYKYEKNLITNIPSDVVERMALYYNTTPAYIMGWEDETGNKTEEGQLTEIYARNLAMEETDPTDQKILDLLHNVDPASKASVVQILESLQPQPGLPSLGSKKD